MRDIHVLDKSLLNSEFELARALHDQMRGQGYSAAKAAAMIYRHGYLDGRESQKSKIKEAYKRLHAAQPTETSQPEAIIEGSEENV